MQGLGFHIGRGLLASLFILGAINKLANFAPTAARMEEVGLSPASLLLPLTIMLEFGAGLMIALGVRYAWVAALALALFTLATNLFFHRFWELEEPIRALELSLFFKNVAIAGGLVFVAAALAAAQPSKQKGAQK